VCVSRNWSKNARKKEGEDAVTKVLQDSPFLIDGWINGGHEYHINRRGVRGNKIKTKPEPPMMPNRSNENFKKG